MQLGDLGVLGILGCLEKVISHRQACHDDGDHRHQLDENVERRAGGVLEGIANGVAHDGRMVAGRVLAAEIAFFNKFLGIVPGSA